MSRPTTTSPCTSGTFPSNRVNSIEISGDYNYSETLVLSAECSQTETATMTFSGNTTKTTSVDLITNVLFYFGEGCCTTGGDVYFGSTPSNVISGGGSTSTLTTPSPTACGTTDNSNSLDVSGIISLYVVPVTPDDGLCPLYVSGGGGGFDFYGSLTFPVSELIGTHTINYTDSVQNWEINVDIS